MRLGLKVRAGVAGMSEAGGLIWLDIEAVRTGGKLLEEHVGIGVGEQHENFE